MEKTANTISTDLQKFIDKFEPAKFKLITKGIEIRGINDLPKNISQARALIESMKLNLMVVHHAGMLAYRAFEVNVIPPAA